jgi:diguanylate cyclase (GGDEF)-like protein
VKRLEQERVILKHSLRHQRSHIEFLEANALLDDLTGAGTRKAMETFLSKEQSKLPSSQNLRKSLLGSLAMLAIDIDFFKQVNDGYGHLVGDKVLVAFVRLLQQSVRSYDIICRFGGEEFVVVMPNTGASQVRRIGEQIRQAVSEMRFSSHTDLRITVSIGGSVQYHQCDKRLFERADTAMYQAKNNGRNQVVVAD